MGQAHVRRCTDDILPRKQDGAIKVVMQPHGPAAGGAHTRATATAVA